MSRLMRMAFLIATLSQALALPPAAIAQNPCGLSVEDWCTSPKDGACGRHLNARDCQADTDCIGMQYQGESAVACIWDQRGFAQNCPTVGCLDK